MISPYAYIFILAALFVIFSILNAVLIILIKRRLKRNVAENIKTIFPIISPLLDSAFLLINPDGFVSFANDHALKLLKINSEDVEKTRMSSIFSSNEDVNKIYSLESGKSLKLQTNLISGDKEIIPVQLNAVSIKILNNHAGYLLAADDIHLRKITDIRLELEKCQKLTEDHDKIHREYIKKIEKLNAVIQNIFSVPRNNLTDIIKEMGKELHNLFGSFMTTCWILENDNENLKLISQHGLSDKGMEKLGKDFPTSDKIMQALEQKEILISDISSIPNSLRILLAQEGVSNIIEVPFSRKNTPYGLLEFYLKDGGNAEINKQLLGHVSVLLTAICNIFYIKISNDDEVRRLHEEKASMEKRLLAKIENCGNELEELRQLQKLTIGRELKILELKKEINRLESAVPAVSAGQVGNRQTA